MKRIDYHDIKEQTLFLRVQERLLIDRLCLVLKPGKMEYVLELLTADGYKGGISALLSGIYSSDLYDLSLQIALRSELNVLIAKTSEVKINSEKEINDSIHTIFEEYSNARQDRMMLVIVNDVAPVSPTQEQSSLANRISTAILREMRAINGIVLLLSEKADGIPSDLIDHCIYKIPLTEPDAAMLKEKWIAMSGGLMEDYASYLSRRYALSSAQMRNICRIVKIDYTLDGVLPPKDRVIAYCDGELNKKQSSHIGF